MNKNVAIILSIAAILITVTCVGASMINSDGDMKQNTFNGIKINVPHDAKFIEIPNGFKDNTYGISIYTFKDNQSMVNFINGIQGGQIVSLDNQPPQSVAFTQGNTTSILVTNGKEGICVGAVDKDLVIKMANSVVFSNGHPSERSHGVMGIGQKHLDKDRDFDLMVGLIVLANNAELNINSYNAAVVTTVSQTNQIIDNSINIVDNNQSSEYGISDNSSIISDGSGSSASSDSGSSDAGSSASSNSGSSDAGSSVSSDSGSSGSSSTTSSDAGSSVSSDSSSSGSVEDTSYSKSECKQLVKEALQGTGCSISSVDESNGVYTFHIKDKHGDSAGVITVDSATGDMDTSGFNMP